MSSAPSLSPVGTIDLRQLLARMADREAKRSEANVQSDLHTLLLAAPLSLKENDLDDQTITLEQQAGEGRRIDVEAGLCVFEVKRNLTRGHVREDALAQLAGYVRSRSDAMKQRYVGVLTDGAEWRLHHLVDDELVEVGTFEVDPANPDVEGLCLWLESVLSTAKDIPPLPHEIEMRLGATSSGHKLDFAELSRIYERHRNVPTVKLKRELWARLLTSAFGTGFKDEDRLFVEHTLLVATAEVIAHCVIGLDPTKPGVAPAAVLSGQLFESAQVHGVVEADFFDWIGEVPEGEAFIRTLATRLKRFAWHDVEHDVLKVLYESVISTEQRKQLGEYYTPDWLAERVVDAAVKKPLEQRVLDPACGSGTFLFHAIRRYLTAAEKAGLSNAEALTGLSGKIIGMDLHPVAVTFARVTYLLAIGTQRLQADDRPPLSIPVYLGDSIQWGQERTLFTSDAVVVPITGASLFARELRFPRETLSDAGRFDRLVSDIAALATRPNGERGAAARNALFQQHGVVASDQKILEGTFKTLCELHDQGRNHVWGYYVRNLARPVWLSRPENRVDVLVGNPPWLSYRFMTREMQQEFQRLSRERGLWAGAAVATNQDLSALFVLRSVERYLKPKGRFAFVLPWSVLRGRQFAGFRTGHATLADDQKGLSLAFDTAWDLHRVKPAFFPVPASVVSGRRSKTPKPLSKDVEIWAGKLKRTNVSWEVASKRITKTQGTVREARAVDAENRSPYHNRFVQGATVVPRMLFVVERRDPGPLGAGAGRLKVASRRSSNEKAPWKFLPPLEDFVERIFVKPLHVGETVMPYRTLKPLEAVIPWDGKRLLDSQTPQLHSYPSLRKWWLKAEALWNEHRSSDRLSLKKRLDYHRGCSGQLPPAPCRVVYSASGMYLAAAIVQEPAVIEHKLYWGVTWTLVEARYLEAVLNSDALTRRVRPLQSKGEHNPRDFDKYVWQVPIPQFDKNDARHLRLAELAEQAEKIAQQIELPSGKRFETQRRTVREAIAATETGREIEAEVDALLGG